MKPALTVPPQRILAAIDFSEPSRVALTMAARLAVHCSAELHVLHAQDRNLCAVARADGFDFSREVREEMGYFLNGACLSPNLLVHSHVVTGPPSDAVCHMRQMKLDEVEEVEKWKKWKK